MLEPGDKATYRQKNKDVRTRYDACRKKYFEQESALQTQKTKEELAYGTTETVSYRSVICVGTGLQDAARLPQPKHLKHRYLVLAKRPNLKNKIRRYRDPLNYEGHKSRSARPTQYHYQHRLEQQGREFLDQ